MNRLSIKIEENIKLIAVAAVTASMLFVGRSAKAQLFGGTVGQLVNQMPGGKQLNNAAGNGVKAVDQTVTQPAVAGVNHVAHEVGKAADQGGVAIDKNVTQPAAAGAAHLAHEVGKAADQQGVNLDNSIFQPIGRGWTHFWHELDIVGKTKDAAREVAADVDNKAKERINQIATAAGTLEGNTVKDVSNLLHKAMYLLFLVVAGAGAVIAVLFGITQKRRAA